MPRLLELEPEAGYGLVAHNVKITPYGAAQVLVYHSPDYSETEGAGGFGLSYAGTTKSDISTEIGGRLDAAIVPLGPDGVDPARARAPWEHDWVS